MKKRVLSVNRRPLLRWNLRGHVCGNYKDIIAYRDVYLVSLGTDVRAKGTYSLYVNRDAGIDGEHLLELFDVRCIPHPDGMTIFGFTHPDGIRHRFFATLRRSK